MPATFAATTASERAAISAAAAAAAAASASAAAAPPPPLPPAFFFTRTRVRNSFAVVAGVLAAGYAARLAVVGWAIDDYRAHERSRQDGLEAAAVDAARSARPTADVNWQRVWRGVLAEEQRLRREEGEGDGEEEKGAARASAVLAAASGRGSLGALR